jgi:hypothetical protein
VTGLNRLKLPCRDCPKVTVFYLTNLIRGFMTIQAKTFIQAANTQKFDRKIWFDTIRSGLQSLITLHNLNGDQVGAHRVSKELCRVMVELERIKVRPRKH